MARLRDSWRTSLPVAQQPRNPQSESIARTPYETAFSLGLRPRSSGMSAKGISSWAVTDISALCPCTRLVSAARKGRGTDEHEPREASGLGHYRGGWLGSDLGCSLRRPELETPDADLHRRRQLPDRALQLGCDREPDRRTGLR